MTTKQAALHTGYGETTTAQEVIGSARLDGKVAIVTGGYVGVGLETTRALAGAGATVIVPARTPEKARAALSGMARVELETVELSDPASVDAFAGRFLASGRALHILVNNAGIMAIPFAKSPRGFELQFATNHLGHFQLTARLWPALLQAKGARVVALTSRGHRFRVGRTLDDPNSERRPYDKWKAYGQSKRARTRSALALDARGREPWRPGAPSPCTPGPSPPSSHGASRRRSFALFAPPTRETSRCRRPERPRACGARRADSGCSTGCGGVYELRGRRHRRTGPCRLEGDARRAPLDHGPRSRRSPLDP